MTTITIDRELLEQAIGEKNVPRRQVEYAILAIRAALAAPATVPEKCGHCGRRTIDPPWPIKPSTDDRHAQELLAQDITIANMQARHAQELCAYSVTVDKLRDQAASAPDWHDAPNAPDRCWCQTCRPITLTDYRMVLCPECGNKRCPKATDHRNACTGSNEPGQPGSSYPAITAIELPCWRSAPTSAGVWLNSCDGCCTVVTNDEGEWANAGMAAGRWYGPIPPDSGEQS